jgi:RNA polymerase sigma-70 factor (ECF subfamily)
VAILSSGLFDAAHAAWPSLRVDRADFLAYAEARTGEDEHLFVEDLYLAYACAQKSPVALAAFERHYMPEVRAALVGARHRSMPLDELEQLVRTKLFVGDSPKIAQYSGRGPLGGWVRVVALRTAVSYFRSSRRTQVPPSAYARVGLEAGEVLELADQSFPELEFLRRAHEKDLRACLESGLASMSPRDRRILHQHFVQGLTIDRLGDIYGVHRSTAARWVVNARALACERAQEHLAARLGVERSDLESLLGQLRDRLDMSLRRLLEEPDPDDDGAWS